MLISTSKRFIFVANTKTASTTIEHVLGPYAGFHYNGTPKRKHLPLAQAQAAAPELFADPQNSFDGFFKFGVMRDPIDWILSWYRYRLGNAVESPLPADMTFLDFWQRRDWNIVRPDGRKFLQSTMFTDDAGACLADVIIPYGQMADQAADIFGALKVPYSLPHKNVSRIRTTDTPLSAELQAELRDFYATDYALYNRLDAINTQGMQALRQRDLTS